MNAQSSKLVRTGCLILLSCVATMGATTPSKAQAVNLPQPAFPEVGTPWGCYFFDTCQSDDAVAEDE